MEKKIKDVILCSILAGAYISIGGIVFLKMFEENKFIGSLLFSAGLVAVIITKSKLFTGMIGFAKKFDYTLIIVLASNLLIAFLMGLAISTIYSSVAQIVMANKLNSNIASWIINPILCGVLVHTAVVSYQRTKKIIAVILPVTVFVLCGFDHCIANMFYLGCAGCFELEAFAFILCNIVGNSVGAILCNLLIRNV